MFEDTRLAPDLAAAFLSPSEEYATRPEASPGPELSLVIPTFNERDNVAPLLARLEHVLGDIAWEVIFVDDNSPDGTAELVKAIARRDHRVRCLRRVRRRGLSGAVLEGALASAAPYVGVMDGDLQHDEALLPQMLEVLRDNRADIVIGSRFLSPGGGAVLAPWRRTGSHLANWLGRRVLSVNLTDPVSGFFMLRRPMIDHVAERVTDGGFKVLFDIIASQSAPPRCVELPYIFRQRQAGASKLDAQVVLQYASLLFAKLSHDVLSPRLLMFGAVGALGVGVHLSLLYSLLALHLRFAVAQGVAALGAMTSNYLINNSFTFRDRRKHGWALVWGFLRFASLCSVGLLANVAVADLVQQHIGIWWVSGLAGAGVGAAWNFATASLAVW